MDAEIRKSDQLRAQTDKMREEWIANITHDLKITYQLDNGMLPAKKEDKNVVRFLKELVIDILNTPEYENRFIHFESVEEVIMLSFDETLLTRVFRNLIFNAFVHGEEDTEVTLNLQASDGVLHIEVSDNGRGMDTETLEYLFERYYRGTSTEQKPEGSGLGMAIAKSIIEVHGGTIAVSSMPDVGTTFHIAFVI